ncbi:MAG: hypothetical protein GX315_08690 [Spirochaetales bacterium]|nr:hypothetical protein [Spirochaetales bacterium]
MRRFALCVLALFLVLLTTGCEDDELPLTATQLRIQALLDQPHRTNLCQLHQCKWGAD